MPEETQLEALRVPNTIGAILGRFILEAAKRVQALSEGAVSEEQADRDEQRTVAWLGNTFCGLNSQFEADPGWFPKGLAGNLRFKLADELAHACGGKIPEEDNAVVFAASALFMAQTYSTLYDLKRQGVEVLGESTAPELLLHLKRWTEFFMGEELEFRDPARAP